MRSSCIAAVVAAGVGVLGMAAPASALVQGPGLAASEGGRVALAPGHERPLAHVLGAVDRAQPRPVRAGMQAGKVTPKVDPKQSVVPGLDLTIAKSHIGPFKQGQHNATYVITVGNLGFVNASGIFEVTDALPASMTATSLSGVGWDCSLALMACGRLGFLSPGMEFSPIYLTVNVADDAPEFATNTATLTAGINEIPFPIIATATDPTRILSGDEDRGPGKGGVNVKINNENNNHNDSTAVNLNLSHTAALAAAHQAQLQAQATKVHTHVNTKLHVHNTAVVVVKSHHHRHDR